jgi:hypothetical protein
MTDGVEVEQKALCKAHSVGWVPAPFQMKVGIARNVRSTIVPVNGLRITSEGDTTGWYIWAGEGDPSDAPDFFVPLHVEHLVEWRPEILKFLGLPPGWRFLTDGKYEDVWQDLNLLAEKDGPV